MATSPPSSTSLPLVVKSNAPVQFSHQIHTSLTSENYLVWRLQVLAALRGHGLVGFVDGSRSPPAQVLTTTGGSTSINPELESWNQQDQLILSWLFSSISPSLLTQVVRCETSASLWCTLAQIHSSQSMAKILDLKLQLQTAKKGSDPCSQYLQKMQILADRLRSIGSDVSDSDLILYTMQGLSSDFESFVTALSMRATPPTMYEFSSLLLAHEARILTNLRSSSTSAVHLTTKSEDAVNNSSDNQLYYAKTQPSNSNYRGKSRGRGNSRGRGRGRQTNSAQEQLQCQICARWGHAALECYHRFDIRFTGPVSSPSTQMSPGNVNSTPQALIVEPAPPTFTSTAPPPWYVDSGASSHVTNDLNAFSSYYPYTGPDAVHIGNGKSLSIIHKGVASISTGTTTLHLENVLHVPKITKNLLSVSQLAMDNRVIVEFSSQCCFIKDQATQQTLLTGTLHNGLYKLQQISHNEVFQVSHHTAATWHNRLAHCSTAIQDQLNKKHLISITNSDSSGKFVCSDCNRAKAHRIPFVPSLSTTSQPLEVIHTDLWGPAPVASHQGHRYYVNFTDEHTRFSWIYTCACKSDITTIFQRFRIRVENLLSTKIKKVQCDGGTEFKPLMRLHPDITFQISCPHTPQQNGLAERKHRHIVELGLANLFHASIPLHYWDYIFESVVFVINRLPSTTTGSISPFEKLFKQQPDYNFLHTLGCSCFPLLRPFTDHKLEPRSEKCVFLGYSTVYKGYYCLHQDTGKVHVSRHVTFNEIEFPFKLVSPTPIHSDTTQITSPLVILPNSQPPETAAPSNQLPTTPTTTEPEHQQGQSPPRSPVQQENAQAPIPNPTPHTMITRTRTNTLKPKQFPDHQVYTMTTPDQEIEPTCYSQAVKHPLWRQAMAEELSALAHNATWDLVELPSDANTIGCKWLFKLKYNADGTIQRYKARLVAKGYNQQEGIDYFETFSPVVKPATIRIVLTIALNQNWSVQQLDVNNAFLHGELQETVYMEQPPGFQDQNYPQHVCKLKKSLYGLKQAPRAWFSKLRHFLLSQTFKSTEADHSLFIYSSGKIVIYLLVYVDDILITGNDQNAITALISTLQKNFSIKTLGKLNYFLGIEVTYTAEGIHLSQSRYLQNILERAHMTSAKPCQTPIESGKQLSKFSGTKMKDSLLYRSIVGALQYATITRPDIAFAVNKAAQFMAEPTDLHWQLVKRILRYLKGTITHGLHFVSSPKLSLHAYCDADWAGCPDDRKSTGGFAVYLGRNLISWSSKKQPTVSRSSTEAEYRCLAVTAAELMWITSLLNELNYPIPQSPTLWCDNLGATFLASNPVFHARTKHIELDYHFVREKVVNSQLNVRFICSADQIGDLFTKGLSKARFQMLTNKLHVFENKSRLKGAVEGTENRSLDDSSTEQTGEAKQRLQKTLS
jgi:Reverse transcriptase (RNA-dependent DNA polymerase)/gag-polypeptide of LTR copia-type